LLASQIFEELNEVLGEGEVPRTGEDIRSLKYLHNVINETLRCAGVTALGQTHRNARPLIWASYLPAASDSFRLHAVVPRLLRCAREDDVLPSGYKITAGTNVIYQTYMLHRDERFWGPDALQFDPERWMDGRTKRCAKAAPS